MHKLIKQAGFGACGLIAAAAAYAFFSPRPAAWYVRQAFRGGLETEAPDFAEAAEKTVQYQDIDYESQYRNGRLDVILTTKKEEKTPVVFWMHGGAYVGGDKQDASKYATYLAASGYNVININYALAPSAAYPAPLIQLDEAYRYIKRHAGDYGLDLTNIFFAGDSAGAQIVSQYAAIQLNEGYSPWVPVRRHIDPLYIKGVLLFCGPYDLRQIAGAPLGWFNRFLFKRIGWAYIGTYNWEEAPALTEISMLQRPPEKFAPTFITDGNKNSFDTQGRRLAALLSRRVPVRDIFYDKDEIPVEHEYQFQMDKPAARQTFRSLTAFIDTYSRA